MEVKQGLVKVLHIAKIDFGPYSQIFRISTDHKYPEVVSWNSSSLTILPSGFYWDAVTPDDYTVIRFPETNLNTAIYHEDKYTVFFAQFAQRKAENLIWES